MRDAYQLPSDVKLFSPDELDREIREFGTRVFEDGETDCDDTLALLLAERHRRAQPDYVPSRQAWDMAIIVTVEAKDYEEAQSIAEDIAAGLGDTDQMIVSAVQNYAHEDTFSDSRRVVYLHNEDRPLDGTVH